MFFFAAKVDFLVIVFVTDTILNVYQVAGQAT